jgi:hypothetical protein
MKSGNYALPWALVEQRENLTEKKEDKIKVKKDLREQLFAREICILNLRCIVS